MSRGEILLLRHGRIVQSSPRVFVGQRDLPLDEEGRRQLQFQGRRLAGLTIHRAVASDLSRCVESARLLLDAAGRPDLPVEPEPGLREITLGRWEGLTSEEVRARFGSEYERRGQDIAGTRPSGGESFEDLERRVWPLFETLCARVGDGERLLLVAHGGVNRVLICHLLGMPLARLFHLEQDYGCLNLIALENGSPARLVRMNLPALELGPRDAPPDTTSSDA